ncbi:DUF1365 domain-containing protein [Lignipirellula cremea]|uniref:DUF1365 domain-containing protein n=1 Tax=Lignipirellula cremea TaxID=2528010 RepID=A0A518DL07_9BACT|nr:DUF1365 domain-containing protein [Lignipirellula cremea]QDU92506.1 hypothetical protein Pla8534_02540 [Lignipirellula cremea]
MHSCIYEGTVTHRRREPVDHRFQYRLFMVYLDLDELPSLVGPHGLIASSSQATRSFLRSDHLFDPSLPLADEVRELVREQTGQRPVGPIRLLTQLRCLGYYMSPLNLFYVFDASGRRVEHVLAEVNNTPWNERHVYLLWDGNREGEGDALRFVHDKEFHVSPFMEMEMCYRWKLSAPGENLQIDLTNLQDDRRLFHARMTLQRRELNRPQLRRMTFRYPLMTAQIIAGIHYQALKLWWKKCPVYSHPTKRASSSAPTPKLPTVVR